MAGRECVRIVEVGPRDGLQNLAAFVATDRKIGLIRELAACGLREIQIGGFVHPQAIPQFRDIREVAAGVNGLEGVALTALVPNLPGARAAVACGLRKLNFFFSVSRSHNRSNVRQTPEESLAALKTIREELFPGVIEIRVDLATAFGCPFEGPIPIGTVLRAVEATANLGIRQITLCDTVGFGNPRPGDISRGPNPLPFSTLKRWRGVINMNPLGKGPPRQDLPGHTGKTRRRSCVSPSWDRPPSAPRFWKHYRTGGRRSSPPGSPRESRGKNPIP